MSLFSSSDINTISKLPDQNKISLVKDIFNTYFKDHLYGIYRSDSNIILSSGSVDHRMYSIPDSLKYFIYYALEKDWYGYSDSRGRLQSRRALADYENTFFSGEHPYISDNICVTMGATAVIASLFSFIRKNTTNTSAVISSPAICVIPNYPPLVKAMAQSFDVKLVEVDCTQDDISLAPVIESVDSNTPVVFLQTVINPSGKKVSEDSLEKLINSVPENTLIILDECHECFGDRHISVSRSRKNVIRVKSLSKEFLSPGIKLGWFIADSAFITEYYEHASSSYGSPASIFYFLLEGLAIFETHKRMGEKLDVQFFSEYDIDHEHLNKLYEEYVLCAQENERLVLENRKFTIQRLQQSGFDVVSPTHSINVLFSVPDNRDSYSIFLDLLKEKHVSVYPGILNFIFSKPFIRISPNVERNVLELGLDRIIKFYH